MTTINYIAIYMLCGIIFSAGFEHLLKVYKHPGRKDTNNWQRTFWVTAWPYCLIKFIIGYNSVD
jgi:hypothetical protein|tara:strand:+ start:402 stop:593 length:192 start_codon:yes stop_codon:yes gene_type:complete